LLFINDLGSLFNYLFLININVDLQWEDAMGRPWNTHESDGECAQHYGEPERTRTLGISSHKCGIILK